MTTPPGVIETDVVVVGSGPGGATVARELSRRGKRVVICESGRYHRRFGNTLVMLGMMDRLGLTFSQEGTWVIRPKTVGGASVVFSATAFKPPAWLKEKYGIDLDREVAELYREIPIAPLPRRLLGPAAQRIMAAARARGLDWHPLDKWIRPERCQPGCGKCSLGCPNPGAKWTAREFVEQARQKGAQLLERTRVDRVLQENGTAVGVRARGPAGWLDIRAEAVVLSAGGQGTPPLLQRLGLFRAGQGFFVDPLWFVSGTGQGPGSLHDIPMSAGVHLESEGIVMTDFTVPPLMFTALLARAGLSGLAALPRLRSLKRMLTIMIKVRDGLEGRINLDESFSKPLDHPTWAKLNQGAILAEDILLEAGVPREGIIKTAVIASHPGGTVRIGELLDSDCQAPVKNCYCLDTSVLPRKWGMPPTLTVAALGKRLARHLDRRL